MSHELEGAAPGPSQRWVEIGMAIFTLAFAVAVIGGSMKVGYGWSFDGPQPGFFPFYVGVIVFAGSLVNLFQAWKHGERRRIFAEWGQLWQVGSVVAPTALYVGLVPWIGIYAASILLIAGFMKWFGRYRWPLVLAVAIGVPVVTFVVFERWFLVPLPKGPIEDFLGY